MVSLAHDIKDPPCDIEVRIDAEKDAKKCPTVPHQSNMVDCGICALWNMRVIAVQAAFDRMDDLSQIQLPRDLASPSTRDAARDAILKGLLSPAVVHGAVGAIAAEVK